MGVGGWTGGGALALWAALSGAAYAEGFEQSNLVSDLPGIAAARDEALRGARGLVIEGAHLTVIDRSVGLASRFRTSGRSAAASIVVGGPGTSEGGDAPVAAAVNDGQGFLVAEGGRTAPARLLVATESGTIIGWTPEVNARRGAVVVDRSGQGAVYEGIAIVEVDGERRLYATNFQSGYVDVFDERFQRVCSFTDPDLPVGFTPFGIARAGRLLIVTYAKRGAEGHAVATGSATGLVDLFHPDGRLLRRLVSFGPLDAPWGVAVAPSDFGRFAGALLVGNSGDGRINAFDRRTGNFLGALPDRRGRPIRIDGLRGLGSSDGGAERGGGALYFTAAVDEEAHALVGALRPSARGD